MLLNVRRYRCQSFSILMLSRSLKIKLCQQNFSTDLCMYGYVTYFKKLQIKSSALFKKLIVHQKAAYI